MFARLVYRLLSLLLAPLALLWWLGRMIRRKAYRAHFFQRLGFIRLPKDCSRPLWVHAVSVGEVITVAPMLDRFCREHPSLPVVLTVMTPTGRAQAQRLLPKSVTLFYVPFDFSGAVRRFMKRVAPRALLLVETELWPNMLWYARDKNIPVFLCNARLSQRSYQGYAQIKWLFQGLFKSLHVVGAQTDADAKRFVALGIDPAIIHVLGNLKYDITQDDTVHHKAALWRKYLAEQQWVIAASTHEGEEAICLTAFLALKHANPQARLCLAPRHPHRIGAVRQLCQEKGLRVVLRSTVNLDVPWEDRADVLLVDSLGELCVFYGMANSAFVGGSLIRQGGHNPIEPIDMGCPVITGPHVFNFSEVYQLLQDHSACRFVKDAASLAEAWYQDLEEGGKRIHVAKEVVVKARGATDRSLQVLERFL